MFQNVFHFSSLIVLDISENEFRNIHPDLLQGLTNIQDLYAVDVNLAFTDSQISESLSKSTIHGENWYFLTPLTFLPRLLLRDQRTSLKNDLDRYMFFSLSNSLLQLEKLGTLRARNTWFQNFAKMVKLKDFLKIESIFLDRKSDLLYLFKQPVIKVDKW